MKWTKRLGPGLLFAGAAIGVSHLVQSTRAGADFGWGLLWALLLANLMKYPFLNTEPLCTSHWKRSTRRLCPTWQTLSWGYFFLNLATMFTIQTAVTIVTASLASILFGQPFSLVIWSAIIIVVCLLILWTGNYHYLDKIIKWIILILTLSTLIAVFVAGSNNVNAIPFQQIFPKEVH